MYVFYETKFRDLNQIQMIIADSIAHDVTLDACESLDDAERIAKNHTFPFSRWLVYRGGSHVAVIHDGERVLLVTEASL